MDMISIPPFLDDTGFLQLDAYVTEQPDSRIVLAAGANTWASAGALVALRGLVDDLYATGRAVSLALPSSSSAALRFVTSGLSLGLPISGEVRSSVSGWAGVPILELRDARDAERFAGEVFVAARSAGSPDATFIAQAAGELAANGVTHSGSPSTFAVFEYDEAGYELAVVDRGVGIRQTWSARFSVSTDADALLASVSLLPSPEPRGLGLPFLAARTAASGVELVLRSGRHGIRIRHRHPWLEELASPLPGTFAIVRNHPA